MLKTHDTLGRLFPYADPISTGTYTTLGEPDYIGGEWLNCHGCLTTLYLYEAQKHLRRDYTGFQKRMRNLWRERNTPHCGPYLTRIKPPLPVPKGHNPHVTYALTNRFRLALSKRVPIRDFTDKVPHRFMNATITASLRLAAMPGPIQFLTRFDIYAHPRFPAETRKRADPFTIRLGEKRRVTPDDFFALRYPGDTYRFCVLEADRATESIDYVKRVDLTDRSYGHKLEGYIEILSRRLYIDAWGIPDLYVLTVTTNAARMQHMIDHLERLTVTKPHLRRWFLFRHVPYFRDEWIAPPVMHELFTDPWLRAGNGPLFLNRP